MRTRAEGRTAKVLAATWQRCKVHFLRNALAHAGKGQPADGARRDQHGFAQESFDTASAQWRLVADQSARQVSRSSPS